MRDSWRHRTRTPGKRKQKLPNYESRAKLRQSLWGREKKEVQSKGPIQGSFLKEGKTSADLNGEEGISQEGFEKGIREKRSQNICEKQSEQRKLGDLKKGPWVASEPKEKPGGTGLNSQRGARSRKGKTGDEPTGIAGP